MDTRLDHSGYQLEKHDMVVKHRSGDSASLLENDNGAIDSDNPLSLLPLVLYPVYWLLKNLLAPVMWLLNKLLVIVSWLLMKYFLPHPTPAKDLDTPQKTKETTSLASV